MPNFRCAALFCLVSFMPVFLLGCVSTMPAALEEGSNGREQFDQVAPSRDPVSGVGASSERQSDAPLRPSAPQGAMYRVSTGDILEVAVFRVPELTRTVEVDGAGNINLPLLGMTLAGGKTVRELESFISARFGERYLQSPDITVTVKDAVGLRITIDGAVRKPGIVTARGDMTLLRAVAEAQGFTETADYSGVIVFRQTDRGRSAARFDVNAIRQGAAPDPPIYGGDTIVVDDSFAKTSWKQFREALPVAGLFRFF